MPKCRFCGKKFWWRVDDEGKGYGSLIHVPTGFNHCQRPDVDGAFAGVCPEPLEAEEAIVLLRAIRAGGETTEDTYGYWEAAGEAQRLILCARLTALGDEDVVRAHNGLEADN